MPDRFSKLATDLIYVRDANGMKFCNVEYHADCTWVKIKFSTDRWSLPEHVSLVVPIIEKYDLGYKLETSWKWTTRSYGNYHFNNLDVPYVIFITSNKEQNIKLLESLSDTTDPLYDCSLFDLRDCMKLEDDTLDFNFSNFSRTVFGFTIHFYTKKSAELFYNTNPFKKILHLERNSDRTYNCHIYMDDKIPDVIIPYQDTKPKKPKKNKSK